MQKIFHSKDCISAREQLIERTVTAMVRGGVLVVIAGPFDGQHSYMPKALELLTQPF